MIIKNKQKLVERAKAHKNADHITNQTYADVAGSHNGDRKEDWKLCAIGCLATETSLEKLLEQFGTENVRVWQEDEHTHYYCNIDEEILIDKLVDDFGICNSLARVAEAIFESVEEEFGMYDELRDDSQFVLSYEERQNFPTEFAQALPEGTNITDDDVFEFCNSVGIDIEYISPGEYVYDGAKDDFLEWLRSL
jgi:protease II